MQIIKNENAVFKQSCMMFPIPVIWVYHLNFGEKQDKFNVA